MRTAFFIDGYNLFYGLLAGTSYKWLDLPALLSSILRIEAPHYLPVDYRYFTSPVQPTLASRGQASHAAQAAYLKALKAVGVTVTLGRHQLEPARAPRFVDRATRASRQDLVDIWKLEEKETDVRIALEMYRTLARQAAVPPSERIEQVVLVSADTDLAPALAAIREDFPATRVGVILPRRESSDRPIPGSLARNAHWLRRRVTSEELARHQLPQRVPTKKKPAIKPFYW